MCSSSLAAFIALDTWTGCYLSIALYYLVALQLLNIHSNLIRIPTYRHTTTELRFITRS